MAPSDGVDLSLGPAESVYQFDLLRPATVAAYPVEVETIGGWVGVGLPGGQFVLLDAGGERPGVYRQDVCWPDDPADPLASAAWPMVSFGPWLVAYQRDRWRAAHVLSGRGAEGLPPAATWRAAAGEGLAAPPVVLPLPPSRERPAARATDALLAWLAGPVGGEPTLYTTELSVVAADPPPVAAVPVGELGLEGPYLEATVAAVTGAPPYILLAAGTTVVLAAARGAGRVEPVAATTGLPPLSAGAADRPLGGLPMIGFLRHPSVDAAAFGLAAIGCENGDLLLLPVEHTRVGVGRQVVRGGGALIGTTRHAGEDVFLTFDGRRLKAVNRLTDARQVRDLSGVYRVQWGRVTGRLLAYAGTQTNGSFCTDVIDVVSGTSLGGVADPHREPPRPAVAGRYLFTVAGAAGAGRSSELWLYRRPVVFNELPLALDDDPPAALPRPSH